MNHLLIAFPDRWTADYLNNPDIQAILGIDRKHSNYTMNSPDIHTRFTTQDFWSFRGEDYLAALLERGIRALIYVGDTDWIANWVRMSRPLRMDRELGSQSAELYDSHLLHRSVTNA